MTHLFRFQKLARSLALAVAAVQLVGCAPLVVGGAVVGSAMVVSDRRTSGAQLEDQAIELKAANRIRETVGDRGRINVTSYNRLVLLTGEAANEADKAALERSIRGIENVRSTYNELVVGTVSTLGERSNDALVTTKVKATLIDARDLQANAFKVVTERGVVYLMGRVTEAEAQRATDLTRGVGGVLRVVRVFELLTEAELSALRAAQSGTK